MAGRWTLVETVGGGEVRRYYRGTLSEALAYAARRRALGCACEVCS